MSPPQKTKIIKPRSKQGKRALEKRAPKLVENPKRALIMFGNKTSQVVKDVLTDFHKLKGEDSIKFSRRNADVRPFEAGGEVELEKHTSRQDCSLFAVGSHSKKRPHNLTLGRMYDGRLYDAVELGVTAIKRLTSFAAASRPQLGNKPCFLFSGDGFESDPALRQVKSLFLDFFRGRQVDRVNLAGLDRVLLVAADPRSPGRLLLRQYAARYKKSGTKIPRTELTEMGPSLDLELRRCKAAPVDLEREATRKPKLTKKKVKNVGSDELDGKVGRIYMPRQEVDTIALRKMKGLKRERREAAGERRDAAAVAATKRPRAEEED